MARVLLQLKTPKIDSRTGDFYELVCGVPTDDIVSGADFQTPFGLVHIPEDQIVYTDILADGLEDVIDQRDSIWRLN